MTRRNVFFFLGENETFVGDFETEWNNAGGGTKIVCIIFMLLSFLKDIRLHLTKDANEISSVTKAPQLTGLARAALPKQNHVVC